MSLLSLFLKPHKKWKKGKGKKKKNLALGASSVNYLHYISLYIILKKSQPLNLVVCILTDILLSMGLQPIPNC